jgi:hypothetical protein
MRVELDVFSGRQNPTWNLDADEAKKVLKMVAALPKKNSPARRYDGLGYRGFNINIGEEDSDRIQHVVVYGDTIWVEKNGKTRAFEDQSRRIEKWLVENAKGRIPDALWQNLMTETSPEKS